MKKYALVISIFFVFMVGIISSAPGRDLRKGTAGKVLFRLVDKTDGITPETGIALGGVDSIMMTVVSPDNSITTFDCAALGWNETDGLSNGVYELALTGTETAVTGWYCVEIQDVSVFAPEEACGFIRTVTVYDAIYSTELLPVNTTEIYGSAPAAELASLGHNLVYSGRAETGTLSTTQFTSNLQALDEDDTPIGRLIFWLKGSSLPGDWSRVTAYSKATGLFTVTEMGDAPVNGDRFLLR